MGSPPADLTGPIDVRARARRRRTTIITALAVVVALLLGAGVYVVRYSGAMVAERVVVEGAGLAGADQVRRTAQVPIGTPLARIDLDAVGARVAALAPVRGVTVHRVWPSTVRIEVTERSSVYQLRDRDGYHWVDATGTIFNTTGAATRGVPWALTATRDTRLLRDVATVAAALDPALRRQLDHIQAGGPDEIVLVLTRSRRVVWGGAEESAEKSQVATALMGTKASVYDVSSPQNPTTR